MKSLKTPKMMLVCAAILLVSTTSMASISLSQVAVDNTGEPIVTIGVNSDDDQPWLGYIFIEPAAPGAWQGNPLVYPAAGPLGQALVQDAYKFELTVGGFNGNLPQPGTQFTADLEITGDVTVYLALNSSTAVVDTLDLVYTEILPEPITMSLLGLGGLLIRRKRA